jgi:branched-chain amino acid transport system substrate-binding protein
VKQNMFSFKGATRAITLAVAGILVVAGTAACSTPAATTANAASATSPYKVGLLLGLTGSYAGLGTLQRQAIELYFGDVNAAGGINGRQVELTVLDSASDEGTAVNQLRKLALEDKVDIVIGPSSSGESVAVKPFATSLKIPVLSLASAESIVTPADSATYIFKAFTDTKLALGAQLELAKERGWTKIALLSSNNGYGQEAAKDIDPIAAASGVEIVSSEVFDPKATDVTAQLTKIGTSNPDAVLVWAVNPANAIVAKSAESIGFKPVLFNAAGAGSPTFITNAGTAAENTLLQGSKVLAASSMDPTDPQFAVTQNFVKVYTAKYNVAPGQYEASAWDASILFQNAIEKIAANDGSQQATRDAIRDSLENNTNDVVGVNGIFTFRSDFHGPTGLAGLAVLRVVDGTFTVEKSY